MLTRMEMGVEVIISDDEEAKIRASWAEEAQKRRERLAQFGYIDARKKLYPSLPDQLDMIYHDLIEGTSTWKDLITQIKIDNPKPLISEIK